MFCISSSEIWNLKDDTFSFTGAAHERNGHFTLEPFHKLEVGTLKNHPKCAVSYITPKAAVKKLSGAESDGMMMLKGMKAFGGRKWGFLV